MNRNGVIGALLSALLLAGCNTSNTGGTRPATTAQEAELPPDGDSGASADDNYEAPQLPDMKVGERPDPSSDEGGLWLQSERLQEQAATAGNRVTDPALNAYVQQVACKLAGPYCPEIHVYILRVPAFNAMMMPNGTMIVWTGLLLRVRNEAELAAVLGHEIGHFIRRHSVQRWRHVVNATGFFRFFSMGMAAAGVPAISDLTALALRGSLSSFSRDNEREADEIGIERMADKGYDPREAAKVWENLIQENKRGEVPRKFSIFLSSHPRDTERQTTLEIRAKAIIAKTGKTGDTGTARYRTAIASERFSMLRDEIRQRRFKRNLALIKGLLEDGFRPAELHFFKGEVFRLRDNTAKKDRRNALDEYKKALALGNVPTELYHSMGILERRMGHRAAAADAFSKYLALRPGAPDAPFLLSYIKETGHR